MNELTPIEIKEFCNRHSLSQRELAQHLDVTVQAVEYWIAGKRKINPLLKRALRDLERELKESE